MPIKDLQRAWREIGRIRIGDRGDAGDGNPRKLLTFRLTSSSEDALLAAAGQYGGGRPDPWRSPAGPAWQLTTESATLDVVIPPGDVFSQWWERWTAAGCERRCDGETETRREAPCVCPADLGERAELAKRGGACRPITRLAVILPHLPDLGIWRLETHSQIAARELAATMAAVEMATARGIYVPGRLRLEQRRSRRPGEKPHDYGIPVLELPELRADRILAGGTNPAGLLETSPPDEDAPAELEELEERPVWTTAASSDQAERVYQTASDAIRQANPGGHVDVGAIATEIVQERPVAGGRGATDRPSYLDPDSPDFLGPEPEWVTERRTEQPARRAEAERGHTSAPDPGGARRQNPETAPAPPAQPAPADPPPPPRVDHQDEVPPDAEAAQLIDGLHELATQKHRTPDELDRFIVIESGLHEEPTLQDIAELLPGATRRGYARVRRRFELGDYDLSAFERATRKAATTEAARATRMAAHDGGKIERRSGDYGDGTGWLETYTPEPPEPAAEESST